jgi:hypothetical protein
MENAARKLGLQIKKICGSGKKNALKPNKIGHLKIKNYKFERVQNFKYL